MADLGHTTVNEPGFQESDSANVFDKAGSQITTASLRPNGSQEASKEGLLSIGVLELLEVDDRPVFITDLTSSTRTIPVYCNASLREIPLLESKLGTGIAGKIARDPKFARFIEWAVSGVPDGVLLRTTYCGIKWTAKTLRKRWRIVFGDVGSEPAVTAINRRQSEFPPPGRSQTTQPERSEKARSNRTSLVFSPHDTLEAQLAAFRLRRDENIQTYPSVAPDENRARRGSVQESEETQKNMPNGHRNSSPEVLNIGRIDFTSPSTTVELSDHLSFVLNFDWASTALGPIKHWLPDLRRMANILMTDPRPAAMYWGMERVMLYNEPYMVTMNQRHPGMMGKRFAEAWAEVEGDFTPAFDTAYETGKAFVVDDARFYIERHGYLEETYFCISIIPFSTQGNEVGFYNPVFDTTRQVIADRRMAFLLRLGQYIASSREPRDFWQQLLLGLQPIHVDLPFAILYSTGSDINETLSESSEQSQYTKSWSLEGTVRIPPSCEVPSRITTERGIDEFLPGFQELIKESLSVLTAADGTLPIFLQEIQLQDGLPCDSAVLLPIRSTSDTVLGFMIIGLNPRKKFDDDYSIFAELLNRQLTNSMASAVLFEEEIRRGRMAAEQAAQDRNLLSQKLAIQEHETIEIETRFRRMADLAPVGMFHIDPEGALLYANNDYYTLTEHPRDVSYPMSWYNVIAEDEFPKMDREWGRLLGGETVSFELRLRRPFVAEEFINGERVEGPTWILAAAYPERADDGSVIGVLGTLTDISRQKYMEGFQKRKMLEAVELKRQQENFIDMTSHEMRNPLSAIIQSADWICTSLSEYEGSVKGLTVTLPTEVTDGFSDAAQTVILCAQHQKRIIDDILTLSKLDSDLLLITPVEVQPISVIHNALRMFDNELQKSDMELRFHVDPSYSTLAVDWVKLDPSRLLQVFINLTTNAIKFTQSQPKRKIKISIAASTEKPPVKLGLEYLPRSSTRKDMSKGLQWGTGEMVYIYIEVEDTGRGLDVHERNLLFKRFSQASPRTHVQYGGSGLGLFISRELTELQGGQIGVASEAGVGSTFAFYVKARRCSAPQDSSPLAHPVDMESQAKIITPAAIARIQRGAGPGNPSDKKSTEKTGAPNHVLIVEDNIVNQKVLSKQLRSAGCIVSVANHGGEALAFIETSRYWKGQEGNGKELSVVLMDLEMPVMDGLTCVMKIRQLQREGVIIGHIPVIAVTANVRSEQIANAKESGMDSVVTKPFRIPELLPEIERQIRRGGERMGLERAASAPA